jgi:hypothetical protein
MTSTFDATAQLQKPVLKEGSKGEAVKELQRLLLKYNAYVTIGSSGATHFVQIQNSKFKIQNLII